MSFPTSGRPIVSLVALLGLSLPAGAAVSYDECDDDGIDCLTIWQAHSLGYLEVESTGTMGEAVTWTNTSAVYDVCLDEQTLYTTDETQAFYTDIAISDAPVRLAPGDTMTAWYGSYTTANGVKEDYLGEYGWWCVEEGFYVRLGKTFDFLGEGVPEELSVFTNTTVDMDGDGVDDLLDWVDDTGVQAQHDIWDWEGAYTVISVGKVAVTSGSGVTVTLSAHNWGSVAGDATIIDIVPAGWTASGWSQAPDSETVNADGSTTLTWTVSLDAMTGGKDPDLVQISYTITDDDGADAAYLELPEASAEYDDGAGTVHTSWSLPAAAWDVDSDGDGTITCEVCDGRDNDGDGLVDEDFDEDGDGVTTCEGDCDDADASVTGADADGDGVLDCDDCDDSDASLTGADADGDGYIDCDDCDDTTSMRSPGVPEVCDGIDNDCDLSVDEGYDADGDGVTTCAGDCDDSDASVTGADADGDGVLDCDDCDDSDASLTGADADGDGFVDCDDCDDSDASLNLADADGDGVSTCDGDCDDSDASLTGVDADGDGVLDCDDCDDSDPAVTGADADGDGFVDCDDCDDSDPAVFPGAEEECNGIDDDCDGTIDEGFDADGDGVTTCEGDCDDEDPTVLGADNDGDGVLDCDDCDDTDPSVTGADNDGDGVVDCDDCDDDDPDYQGEDGDGDGYKDCEDCDDCDPARNLDDADGDGYSTCDGDCDDTDPTIHPYAMEQCAEDGDDIDGIDQDCNGVDNTTTQEDGAEVVPECIASGPGTERYTGGACRCSSTEASSGGWAALAFAGLVVGFARRRREDDEDRD